MRYDQHSDELLARGGDPEAHGILQRAGLIPVVRTHETYHRAPKNLDTAEEIYRGIEAVAQLRLHGYHVDCDPLFEPTDPVTSYQTLGSTVAHLATQIRSATTTDEVAEALVELTADHDGVLAAVGEVLNALAEFHDGLGDPLDKHISVRLGYLTDEYLGAIRTDLSHTLTNLADRHTPHPGRSTCAEEVPASEQERSAVCACPPPPRAVPSPPPPPLGTGPRR